jgi:hypothetical protein
MPSIVLDCATPAAVSCENPPGLFGTAFRRPSFDSFNTMHCNVTRLDTPITVHGDHAAHLYDNSHHRSLTCFIFLSVR